MKYVQCPTPVEEIYETNYGRNSMFLAGGITGCGDWQSELTKRLANTKLTIVNPRREVWDDNITTLEQVTWEYKAMYQCYYIMFWFTPPTLNPITLLEYGKILAERERFDKDSIFVGVHPDYARREDVIVQTKLARPRSKIKIYDSLDEMVDMLNDKFK